MGVIAHRVVIGAGNGYLQNDIRALTLVEGAGRPVVLAAGGTHGALISLTLDTGGQARIADSVVYSSGMGAALNGNVSTLDVGDQQVAMVGHTSAQGLVGYVLEADGGLGEAMSVTVPGMQLGATGVFTASASGFVYVASKEGAMGCFQLNASGVLSGGDIAYDTADSYLSVPVGLVTTSVGGQTYLLALCDKADGVTAYGIDGATGHLSLSSSMDVQEGFGIFQVPVAMELTVVEGRSYVLIASSAEQGYGGALSVMELTPSGELHPVDHVLDTLDIRFGRVQDMAVLEHEGRSYVVVAGGDEGISLFTVMPGGRLLHLDTIEDAAGLGLSSIFAMMAMINNNRIEVFMASQDKPGLTQFTVPLEGQGVTRQVESGGLNGTVRDDLLVGGSGNNTITGGDGQDTLSDGQGEDRLTGGNGADVFLLEQDGKYDVITDFEVGTDRINLSLYPMLYSAKQIKISSTTWGALMDVRGDITEIRRAGGGKLSEGEVLASLDWDTGRVPVILATEEGGNPVEPVEPVVPVESVAPVTPVENLRIEGNGRTNTLLGFEGDDWIDGLDGADSIAGGSGNDTLLGGGGADRLEGRNGFDLLEGGAGNDLLFGGTNADTLLGEAGDDTLFGEVGHDLLKGGTGDDSLVGGIDNDTLYGGDGADTLKGGANRDVLFGDAGDDFLNGQNGFDWLSGGLGDDTLVGEANADTLLGGYGNDFLDGGDGFDRLEGGAGNDSLLGGSNADTLLGEDGADTLKGEVGHDFLNGGAGDDLLFGGTNADRLLGGDGHDTLDGGDGFDRLEGEAGNDFLLGGSNGDTLLGGSNGDTLLGGAGADTLNGEEGHDILDGGAGNDYLIGGDNADTLSGGDGKDTLVAGPGLDILIGGAGADVFLFHDGDNLNSIQDFTPGQDVLHLNVSEQGFGELAMRATEQQVQLFWTGGSVILENVTAGSFDAGDVIFI